MSVQISDEIDRALRCRLWLSHGHSGQYGDDGEMQCSACIPFGACDYKREPYEQLLGAHLKIALANMAKVSP